MNKNLEINFGSTFIIKPNFAHEIFGPRWIITDIGKENYFFAAQVFTDAENQDAVGMPGTVGIDDILKMENDRWSPVRIYDAMIRGLPYTLLQGMPIEAFEELTRKRIASGLANPRRTYAFKSSTPPIM